MGKVTIETDPIPLCKTKAKGIHLELVNEAWQAHDPGVMEGHGSDELVRGADVGHLRV